MYQSNQRSCLHLRAPASQHGANRFAPYCPPPYILFAPRISTIPLPDVSPVLNNAGHATSMLASSAQTLLSQLIPMNLPEQAPSTIASQLAHQSQPVQQAPSILTTVASARPSLTKAACHSSIVPDDSAPPPAASDAMPAQPVVGAARHSLIADADSPSSPSAADVQNTADNVVARSSSSAPRSATSSSGSSFKDGHVELESFTGGICVLPVLATWESIESLTVTGPITINDLHLILYQATELKSARFASVVEDTRKDRCRFKFHAQGLRQLALENIQTPIGSLLDDLQAPKLQQIYFAYAAAPAQPALCADEQSHCRLLKHASNKGAAGTVSIVSNDTWYKDNRADALQEELKAVTKLTWIPTVG
ncbi:hypothetical protein EV122DRAFT_251523 [Schizophyllum commune]